MYILSIISILILINSEIFRKFFRPRSALEEGSFKIIYAYKKKSLGGGAH